MGRQINFFLHTDDQPEFDNLLKSFGDIVILPYYHPGNKVETIPDTLIRDIKNEGKRVYIVQKQDLPQVQLTYIARFGYWLVEDRTIPVVHFDRSVTEETRILRGRLYFQTDFVDPKKTSMVKKQENFVKWADSILQTVRRKLYKYKYQPGAHPYTEYLGEHANNWREEHKAEVAAAGMELRSTTTLA